MSITELRQAIDDTVRQIAYLNYVGCTIQVVILQRHLEHLLELEQTTLDKEVIK